MGFRRDGKTTYEMQREWANWLATVDDLARQADLPRSVLETEDAWWYFIDKTYSQAAYLGVEPPFEFQNLSKSQRQAFWQMLRRWLSDRWPEAPEYKIQSLRVTYETT